MDDYIKRSDAICLANNSILLSIDANDIARIPSADVRENVHGEWIVENLTERFIICPFCSEVYKRRGLFNFCPNFGADMRKEK